MKDLNDFINRANRFKSNLRQSVESNMLADNTTNKNMVKDLNEEYEVYEDNMMEIEDRADILPKKSKSKSRKK